MRADGDERRPRVRQRDRLGHVAARARRIGSAAPATTRTTESSARVWIVAIVGQEGVGDAGQRRARLVVVARDRLVASDCRWS